MTSPSHLKLIGDTDRATGCRRAVCEAVHSKDVVFLQKRRGRGRRW